MRLRTSERRLGIAVGLAALAFACGGPGDEPDAAPLSAEPIADQAGAVCGMLVREQSAPRAQVVHRDGSRFFFCSIGDLLVHRSAPSPHGLVEATFVEVLDLTEDPLESHAGDHPWSLAEHATYVVGVKRRSIMGSPVLVYGDPATATRVVDANPGSSALSFDELVEWWSQRQSS